MSKVTILTKPKRIVIASKGVQGPPGPVGEQGIQGPKGDTGDVTPEALAARDAAQEAATTASTAAGTATGAANAASDSASDAAASADLAEQARLLGATIGFSTKADMDASLAHPAGTLALVTNDPTAAKNGTYRKTGASGSGVWVQSADRVTGLEGRVGATEATVASINLSSYATAETTYELGTLSPTNGSQSNSTTRLRSDFIPALRVSVSCAPTQQVAVFRFNPDGTFVDWTNWQTAVEDLVVPGLCRILVRKVGDGVFSSPAENTAVVLVDRHTTLREWVGEVEARANIVQGRIFDQPSFVFEGPSGYPLRPRTPMAVWFGPNPPPIQSGADEWRETTGFLYVAPIWDYEVGAMPSDWQARWLSAGWSVGEGGESTDGRLILFPQGGAGRKKLAFTPYDADADANVEVVARVRITSDTVGTVPHAQLIVRGAGEAGSETGYALTLWSVGSVAIHRYDDGHSLTVDTGTSDWEGGVWLWMRFRAIGAALQGKVWRDSEPEPDDWSVEAYNEMISAGGDVGLGASARSMECSYFAVASGGEVAPGGS